MPKRQKIQQFMDLILPTLKQFQVSKINMELLIITDNFFLEVNDAGEPFYIY